MRNPYDKKATDACKLWWAACMDNREWGDHRPVWIMQRFNKFLGGGEARDYRFVDIHDPEVRRKLDLILGPNGHVILKIMQIKQDEKQDGNH